MMSRVLFIMRNPLLKMRPCYRFSKQQNKQRARKLRETRDLREIREKEELLFQEKLIQKTKGSFNPFIQYAKIHTKTVVVSLAALYILYYLLVTFIAIQIYEDPFNKKKSLMLVSSELEKIRIREGYVNFTFCGEKISSSSKDLSRRLQEIGEKISRLTTRTYDVQVVKNADHLVIWMPEKVLVSCNLLINGEFTEDNLMHMLLLMEGLFARRIHIKNINLTSQQYFINKDADPSSESSLVKIYTHPYSSQEIWDTIDQICLKYAIPPEKLTESLVALSRITKHDTAQASLRYRLNLKATLASKDL